MALQIRRGLEADLPASPTDGELLYSTDTNKLYIGYGGTANSISGLALTDLSVTDLGGDGSLTYNNTTGVFTYTGPSATQVRAHFSAGSGISITDGVITSTASGISLTSLSANSSGDGSLSYNNTTGVFTYAGPGTTEYRSAFSAGTGITITNGVIAASGTGYANSDVKTYLGTFDGNIIPDTDNTRDLGSASKTWRHVYIGPGSLYINGKQVISDVSDKITVTTSTNQHLRFETSGTGNVEIATASGNILVQGGLQILAGKNITSSDGNAIGFSNQIAVDSLTSKTTNSNLTLTGNGTGAVTVDDNLTITGNLTVSGTTTTVNAETISLADNIIDLNSNFTTGTPTENAGIRILRGDSAAVQMRWNETNGKWEFTNDGSSYKAMAALSDISVTDSGGDGSLSYNSSTGVLTYTGPSASEVRAHFTAGTGITISSGTIATTITQYTDSAARSAVSAGTGINYDSSTGVISSSITQYTDSAARSAVSVTDSGGDGSLSYNSSSGVFTYTGPSASEVRAHFSAGTGISISSGSIANTGVTSITAGSGISVDTSTGGVTISSSGGVTTGKAIAMAIVFGG